MDKMASEGDAVFFRTRIMGTMTFDLPARLPEDARSALECASVAGGQDCMPYTTQVLVDQDQMILTRQVDESGCLLTPWSVNGTGRVMVSSATLMERLKPYQLALELARGKINQVRGQDSDWRMGGLSIPEALTRQIQQSTLAFSKAVTLFPDPQSDEAALHALTSGFQAADQLVAAYINQVFHVRHIRQPRLETTFACRLRPGQLRPDQEAAYVKTFNAVCLPFAWADIEVKEEHHRWETYDKLLDWAADLGLPVIGGPLVDFSGRDLPHWLWEKETDLTGICSYLTDFVERTVERYQGVIHTWQLTAASNWAGVVALADEELLWLTVRLADVVRKLDASLEIIVGIAQP
jgi:Glycosyl hydrolase family 10